MHGPVPTFGHYPSSMVPLHFCYQFYACLFVLTLFGGISVLALALMTLYEIGGVELVFALCLSCFYGLLKLMLPPWPDATLTSFRDQHTKKSVPQQRLAIDTFNMKIPKSSWRDCDDADLSSKQRSTDADTSSCCPICLLNFTDGDAVSKGRFCGHLFHQDCLSVWLAKSPSCPYCRCDFVLPEPEMKREGSKSGAWGIFDGVFDSIYL